MQPFATFGEVISFSALVLSLGTFWVMMLSRKQTQWKEARAEWQAKYQSLMQQHEVTTNWLTHIDKDVGVLKTQVEIFWKGVAYSSSQVLHSPHTPELDALIEKYQQDRISPEELIDFKVKLRAILADATETKVAQKAARETLLTIYLQYDLHQSLQSMTSVAHPPFDLLRGIEQLFNGELPPQVDP